MIMSESKWLGFLVCKGLNLVWSGGRGHRQRKPTQPSYKWGQRWLRYPHPQTKKPNHHHDSAFIVSITARDMISTPIIKQEWSKVICGWCRPGVRSAPSASMVALMFGRNFV